MTDQIIAQLLVEQNRVLCVIANLLNSNGGLRVDSVSAQVHAVVRNTARLKAQIGMVPATPTTEGQ